MPTTFHVSVGQTPNGAGDDKKSIENNVPTPGAQPATSQIQVAPSQPGTKAPTPQSSKPVGAPGTPQQVGTLLQISEEDFFYWVLCGSWGLSV